MVQTFIVDDSNIALCLLLTMCQKTGKKWRFLHSGSSKGRAGMGKLGRDLWLVAENFKVISPLRPIWAWDCAKYSFIIKLDSFLQVLSRKSRGWGRHLTFKQVYSSLSNNAIGWNNSVWWQISPNFIIVQDGIIL